MILNDVVFRFNSVIGKTFSDVSLSRQMTVTSDGFQMTDNKASMLLHFF